MTKLYAIIAAVTLAACAPQSPPDRMQAPFDRDDRDRTPARVSAVSGSAASAERSLVKLPRVVDRSVDSAGTDWVQFETSTGEVTKMPGDDWNATVSAHMARNGGRIVR